MQHLMVALDLEVEGVLALQHAIGPDGIVLVHQVLTVDAQEHVPLTQSHAAQEAGVIQVGHPNAVRSSIFHRRIQAQGLVYAAGRVHRPLNFGPRQDGDSWPVAMKTGPPRVDARTALLGNDRRAGRGRLDRPFGCTRLAVPLYLSYEQSPTRHK